jgi:hypothetical protein
MVLRGQTPMAEIGVIFECEVGELEDLQRGAKVRMRLRVYWKRTEVIWGRRREERREQGGMVNRIIIIKRF